MASGATAADVSIHVVRHGWHTGIAVPRAQVPAGAWPESAHFAGAEYLEVGWGDRDFYMAPGFNLWYGFKALFWPTPGVLHVVGLQRPPPQEFGASRVVELRVTQARLDALISYLAASFERPGTEAAASLAPGLYGASAFYPSHESFHLFKTCNVWIARALRAAGLPVESTPSAESIMEQARRLSTAFTPEEAQFLHAAPE